jgi:hypothetical protein
MLHRALHVALLTRRLSLYNSGNMLGSGRRVLQCRAPKLQPSGYCS